MLSILLLLISAFLFPGITAIVKAKMAGRKGPGLLQPWFDIIRLLRKGSVYAHTTSFIFQLSGVVYFASVLFAMLLVPFSFYGSVIDFPGDFIFFAYILALGKFFLIAGAMDVGSGFEGMGANREALYSMLVEPAFFILIGALCLLSGHDSFSALLSNQHFSDFAAYLVGGLSAYVLIQITMIENSRMPVDDPKTHLELTMVHEVMVLDHSGFDLGIIKIASALKFAMYGGLISGFFLPDHWPLPAKIVLALGVQILFAASVAILESFRARLKMNKNPLFILSLSTLALLVFITALIITHKI